ncbi:hypothetical protein AB1P65_09315 [Roseibium alexandrii]
MVDGLGTHSPLDEKPSDEFEKGRSNGLEEAALVCEKNVKDFKSGLSFIMMRDLPTHFRDLKDKGE